MNDIKFEQGKKLLLEGWVYLFIGQLIVGGHSIYELADKYPDLGIIQYAFVLSFGSVIIATFLLGVITICYFIAKAIGVKIESWRERCRERNKT